MALSHHNPSHCSGFCYPPKSVNMLWLKLKASPASVNSRDRWASSSCNETSFVRYASLKLIQPLGKFIYTNR